MSDNVPRASVTIFGAHGVGTTSVMTCALGKRFDPAHVMTIGIDFESKNVETDGSVCGRLSVRDGEHHIETDQTLQQAVDRLDVGHHTAARVQWWDVAGHIRFRPLVGRFMDRADALCFVYDVTDASTFADDFDDFMGRLNHRTMHGVAPIVLFGNKADLLLHEPCSVRDAAGPGVRTTVCAVTQRHNDRTERRTHGRQRAVTPEMVAELCKKHDVDPAFVFEGSAKSGAGVDRAMNVAVRLALAARRERNSDGKDAPPPLSTMRRHVPLPGGIRLPMSSVLPRSGNKLR